MHAGGWTSALSGPGLSFSGMSVQTDTVTKFEIKRLCPAASLNHNVFISAGKTCLAVYKGVRSTPDTVTLISKLCHAVHPTPFPFLRKPCSSKSQSRGQETQGSCARHPQRAAWRSILVSKGLNNESRPIVWSGETNLHMFHGCTDAQSLPGKSVRSFWNGPSLDVSPCAKFHRMRSMSILSYLV